MDDQKEGGKKWVAVSELVIMKGFNSRWKRGSVLSGMEVELNL